MRIRPAYIVVLILVIVGGFVLYAALSASGAGPGTTVTPPAESSGPGILPPVGTDQDQIATIEVETDTFDMGTIPNTEPTTKTMTVRNTGQKTLEIKDITTTCGCTTGKIVPPQIKPGGSGSLEITVYPNRVPGFYSHKRLTIMSNAPNAPMQNVDVIADIEPEFALQPEDFDFGTVQKGQSVERKAILRQLGEEPIELLNVRLMDEAERSVSFEFAKRPEPEWQTPGKPEYVITATLEPWAPAGEFAQGYEIITSCTRVPRYMQQVKANIEGFYTVKPTRISFTMRPDMKQETPLGTVTVEADRPIEIVEPKVTGDDFSVSIVPGPTPKSATIELHTREKATIGKKSEEITFFVKAEGSELLPNAIPVRGVVIDLQ